MTDANLVTRLRNGADRFIAFVRKEQYPGPSVYSIPRHPDNIDCLLMESADALAKIKAENQRLRETLTWYGEQARLARLIHSEGDAGRRNLEADGGTRARAAMRSTEANHDD